ncbi:DUF1350 family protein [Merismopedia glauca]|uniref:DUF1350 domain-containing protein n=1 Tax=Merismopedia glauca CCAP 1448/3 TaxID=1296344 RepID=A0A2T1BZ45_9CYAN|nr:DUF1350 family protein [Merismopedia glauca]PSB01272.1 hypothetical protein C7B64_19195 [Merismopedia glauca CCAP 1448/3]
MWQEINGNWVLIPRRRIGVIHFLGGAFVGTAPHLTYRLLLENVSLQGYVVIATPFINTFDHIEIARSVYNSFETTLEQLQTTGTISRSSLPIYGIGHSMGCKLHLLIGSLYPVERAGNILISFNNFAARDAVPLVEQFSGAVSLEFSPSPQDTIKMVDRKYQVRRNLLIRFTNDNLDQSLALTELLQKRFPGMAVAQTLKGSHLTPIGQDLNWQVRDIFTPLDAIAQWMKQEVQRDLNQLQKEIIRWLNPVASF